jgi:tungstate transport system ATP-binding protein
MLFNVTNLTKIYGDRTVLDIPDLHFEEGLIYSLLGPNGSGKTTLLEILSLLTPPTTGKIEYKGIEIDLAGNNLTDLRREIVMVEQNPVLFSTTVFRNLEFGLKIRGISKKGRERIIEDSLDLVGMRDFMGGEAHRLSGGETQRIAIARALACSPMVIFFDEPTANVDVENQIAIERIMTEINVQKKISVIFTTHNLMQASKLSRNVISLFEGKMTSSVYENIFSGKIGHDNDGDTFCLIQDEVRLFIKTEKTGDVRLSIDPLKMKILTDQEIHPQKNCYRGRLLQLTDEPDHLRAVVDIGIPLNILLPKNRLMAEPVNVGNEVWIFCPVEAIQVF